MRRNLGLAAGVALIVASIGGLIFAIAGLFVLGTVEQSALNAVNGALDLGESSVTASRHAMEVVGVSLEQTTQTVQTLESTTRQVAETVESSVPGMEAVAQLLSEDLPTTIESAQQSLETAQASAEVIDGTLRLFSNIPFVNLPYDPDKPLGESLGQVSDSLDGLPARLEQAEQGLSTTTGNLETVGENLATMAGQISAIEESLAAAQPVLLEVETLIGDVDAAVQRTREGAPGVLRNTRIALSLALVWLGVAQIGLLTQGMELIGRARRRDAV